MWEDYKESDLITTTTIQTSNKSYPKSNLLCLHFLLLYITTSLLHIFLLSSAVTTLTLLILSGHHHGFSYFLCPQTISSGYLPSDDDFVSYYLLALYKLSRRVCVLLSSGFHWLLRIEKLLCITSLRQETFFRWVCFRCHFPDLCSEFSVFPQHYL